jgi:uncharacterized repeat protein (TIGR03803 family)
MKRSSFGLLATVLFAAVVCCAQTYTESVVYNFPSQPFNNTTSPSNLVIDSAGSLYGVTYTGGTYGVGNIFKVSASGVFSTLYNFNPNNYSEPNSGFYPCCLVISSSGDLYGTTYQGGLFVDGDTWGGVVFKFDTATKKYSVLHKFGATSSDGFVPAGPLTLASNGNLYGMTNYGGTLLVGTIFEVTPKGVETVEYSFPDALTYPTSNVLRDNKGDFYGLADYGTTLFEVTSSGENKILNNGLGTIGGYPGYMGRSAAGNFYGEFYYEGSNPDIVYSGLWEVLSSDDVLSEYYFTDGCTDPACPSLAAPQGPLLFSNGEIYGTTLGARNETTGDYINGAVYKFSESTGIASTLYNFCSLKNCADGSQPSSGVTSDSKGNLYGTTAYGGANDVGVVFKLTVSN